MPAFSQVNGGRVEPQVCGSFECLEANVTGPLTQVTLVVLLSQVDCRYVGVQLPLAPQVLVADLAGV